MPWIIRSARAEDADSVVALWRASALVVPANDPVADFHRARVGPDSGVLLAVEDAAVVGSAMVGHDGHRGWIYYLAADPARRGEGIGRALVAAAEDWVKARGIPKIQLMVRQTNRGVMGFYGGIGYAETPVAVMQKVLTPYSAD